MFIPIDIESLHVYEDCNPRRVSKNHREKTPQRSAHAAARVERHWSMAPAPIAQDSGRKSGDEQKTRPLL